MKEGSLDRGGYVKLALAGTLAGFANGLLGAGGGIITVFALSKVMSGQLRGKNDTFANALCVMLPLSLLSCIIYAARGHMSVSGFGVLILPAIIGGALGGFLLGKLNASFMKRLFAGIVIISGILLIVR